MFRNCFRSSRPYVAALAAATLLGGVLHAEEFRAGTARVAITPDVGIWMAGYASRTKPAGGKEHDLYAKALALEDSAGRRLLLITADHLGWPRSLSEPIAEAIQKKTNLGRSQIILSASHTHCGPVLRGNLLDMYGLDDEQWRKLEAYRKILQDKTVKLAEDALADLKPATLSIGSGKARFAINRREFGKQTVTIGTNPAGPVDHDVPVLKVAGADGRLEAVVFGYACHNTTLDYYLWCGDYAGFAQIYLEEKYPGAVAMYWAGCGGDQNPHPRRTIALCKQHGKELADSVGAVLNASMAPLQGKFRDAYAAIPIPLDKVPARDQLTADAIGKNVYVARRAKRLLQSLEKGESILDHYPHYPVQVWRLGNQLLWVSLGGEVVVDYALRVKRELGKGRPVWVMGYANDVMAYIPSLRVLREGGYEGETAMIYYGLPSKWGQEIEEKIIAKIHDLVRATN